MPRSHRGVDPDLLVAAALGLFALAFLGPLLHPELGFLVLVGALGTSVVAAGLLGRQRDGIHRALFVGMAPAAGGTLAQVLLGDVSVGALPYHVGLGVTTGLLAALFGYSVGTLEYWLADGTPAPRRRDVARFAVLCGGGLVLVVGVRLYAETVAPVPIG